MADFDRAFSQTMKNEGGYSNRKADFGGETYKGISRRYHPNWVGWMAVDRHKADTELFPANLKSDEALQIDVRSFYRDKFWDAILGDSIENQFIADVMFDVAVHLSPHRAILFLQKALNCLNRNQISYPDIVEDGQFGPKTFGTLIVYLKSDPAFYVIRAINLLRGCHYLEQMRESPSQEEFARGWLSRLSIMT